MSFDGLFQEQDHQKADQEGKKQFHPGQSRDDHEPIQSCLFLMPFWLFFMPFRYPCAGERFINRLQNPLTAGCRAAHGVDFRVLGLDHLVQQGDGPIHVLDIFHVLQDFQGRNSAAGDRDLHDDPVHITDAGSLDRKSVV